MGFRGLRGENAGNRPAMRTITFPYHVVGAGIDIGGKPEPISVLILSFSTSATTPPPPTVNNICVIIYGRDFPGEVSTHAHY